MTALINVKIAIDTVKAANYIMLSISFYRNCSGLTLLSVCFDTRSSNRPIFQGNMLLVAADIIVTIIHNNPNFHRLREYLKNFLYTGHGIFFRASSPFLSLLFYLLLDLLGEDISPTYVNSVRMVSS